MPLRKSASRAAIRQNIVEMQQAGHPHDQAVAAALRAADEAKHGRKSMDKMDGGAGMSPRKAMASSGGDSFGVESLESVTGNKAHPDHTAGTGRKMMADGERGIGNPVHAHGHPKGHHHPQQAAPDHGPTHPGGHGMHEGYKGGI